MGRLKEGEGERSTGAVSKGGEESTSSGGSFVDFIPYLVPLLALLAALYYKFVMNATA